MNNADAQLATCYGPVSQAFVDRAAKIRLLILDTLKKPLIFNHEDNDPVDILITMAAVDATTHQEVATVAAADMQAAVESYLGL